MHIFDKDELKLNEEQATYIKHLRCGPKMHSWRLISRFFTRKYPEFVKAHDLLDMADKTDQLENYGYLMKDEEINSMTDWENGNQLLGIDLCTAAMNFYGESVDDGWN